MNTTPVSVGMSLNILWLYPDILNLHGDRGNVMALERVSRQLGITPILRRVDRLSDPVDVGDADIIVMGAGELAVMPKVVAALTPHVSALKDHLAAGGAMFVSAASGAVVAQECQRLTGGFDGLGLLDFRVRERDEIYGDDLVLRVGAQVLCGIQIRMTDCDCDIDEEPFGRVIYGYGNNDDSKRSEGVRRGNAIVTNLLGPTLVRNPWFTAGLIRDALAAKHPGIKLGDLAENAWELEKRGAEATRRFVAKKRTLPWVVQENARPHPATS